jgi:hypothetical protein
VREIVHVLAAALVLTIAGVLALAQMAQADHAYSRMQQRVVLTSQVDDDGAGCAVSCPARTRGR